MNEADKTRVIMVASRRWQEVAATIDLSAVVRVGAIDLTDWTPEEHEAARRWAAGVQSEMPPKLSRYVKTVSPS